MPYALGLYLYSCLAGVVLAIVAVWLSPFGLLVNFGFVFGAAYLAFEIGRRVFGSKDPPMA
jgi:hypothetical protein